MTSSSPPEGSTPCPRPGCPGRIVNGVCDTCGARLTPQRPQDRYGQHAQQPPARPQPGPPSGGFPAQQVGPPSGGFPAQPPSRGTQGGPPPRGSQPGPPPRGTQSGRPPQRPPAPPAPPALAAPAPTAVVPPPAGAAQHGGVAPGVAPLGNWAPPGQPLRPMPERAVAQRRSGQQQESGWVPPEEVGSAETDKDLEPVDPPEGALSARLSGWEPAPGQSPPRRRADRKAEQRDADGQATQMVRRPGPPADPVATQLAFGGATEIRPGPVSGSMSGSVAAPGPGSGAVSGSRPMTGRGSRSTRGSRGSRASRSRASRRIGAGMVEVPRVPYKDPASAVMTHPEVPENKRFCGNCQKPVGRGATGRPGSPDGVCANCGTAFSFRPKLGKGDVVGGQYEVLGALAHGGLGWIYLARDHNVNGRWVVLKGLIDTGDTAAMAAAVAEKQFLSQVEHANIVKIYNFVQHPDPQTGNLVGYIVMEYIGGQSLRQIALSHKDANDRVTPLPLARVLAYGLEVLPAIGYLHSVGLLYCDLKPDNVIQTDAQLKLIDLGAVRHVDDMESPIFFTSGYSAPEIATEGPSVASDIYTVGRTLAVLSFDFVGYTSEYVHSLPTPQQVPLFSLFGSYYRLLRRATHPDPDRRFESAEEMADQLTGVLREVLALGTREPRPGRSAVFGPEVRTFGAELTGSPNGTTTPTPPDWSEIVAALPAPQVDTDDPAAGLVGGLASTAGTAPSDLLDALRAAPSSSMEAKLWRARARMEMGELNVAASDLAEAAKLDAQGDAVPEVPYDWRISWFRGLLALAARRPRDARALFEHVYDMVPGELAPKLALAISAECCGDFFPAARLYELVWRTDRSYVSAAFGLARVYLAQGDRAGALDVLESVPDRSSHYLAAQMAVIATRTKWTPPDRITERDLVDTGDRVTRLAVDNHRRAGLTVDVLTAAHDWVRAGSPNGGGNATVLGCRLTDRDLRFGLERCYRDLARLAATPDERIELVDQANAIRPRTLT